VIEPQPMGIHGYQTIQWDHASLPDIYWRNVRRMPNGCWTTDWGRAGSLRSIAILRLLDLNPKEAWAITPTCGDTSCVNPGHTCVTMMTPKSKREMRADQRSK